MSLDPKTPVIVDVVRTPIGRARKGSLASLRPDDTLALVVDSLLDRSPALDPADVEELVAGCGIPQGQQGQNIGRLTVLRSARLPDHVTGSTVSRFCASGLDAVRSAVNAVANGQGEVAIAAGVDFASAVGGSVGADPEALNPHLQGHGPGEPDAYVAMGITAENVADRYGVSRADMDAYSQRSQERAVAAQRSGAFDREIVPVALADGTLVTEDDGPRPTSTLAALAGLKPAFKEDGVVTAGNSSPLNDGAAAALIMTAGKAAELGLTPRARILSAATWGLEPELMGVAPIGAIRKALDRAGMQVGDVDVVELNEAFAAQVLPIADEVGIDLDRLNPHGGAIALGHPFGMTGVRILATLLGGLEATGGTIGLETMCVAGGQGEAVVVERLS